VGGGSQKGRQFIGKDKVKSERREKLFRKKEGFPFTQGRGERGIREKTKSSGNKEK